MITLDTHGARGFRAHFPYDPDTVDRIKLCMGFRWEPTGKYWYAEGPESLIDLERYEMDYRLTSAAHERATSFHNRFESILELKLRKYDDGEMFAYQKDGADALYFQEKGILADDVGLGKTKQALDACGMLHEEGRAKMVLFLTHKTLIYNVVDEILTWHPDFDVHVVNPPGKLPVTYTVTKTPPAEGFQTKDGKMLVVVTSYERALMYRGFHFTQPWDVVIFDEAQRIKNHKTETHKMVSKLVAGAPFAFALTATPLELRVEELYSIFSVLRPSVFGSWTRFSRDHIKEVTDNWGHVIARQVRNTTLLKERIGPWVFRRTREDVLKQLPGAMPPVYIYPEMTAGESKLYDGLVSDRSMIEIERMLRLQQFTSSPRLLGYSELGAKFDELVQLLDGWDGVTLVFTRFKKMLDILMEELNLPAEACMYGQLTDAGERHRRVKAFNNGELGRVFISTDAGAHGLNFNAVDMIVHYDKLWNPAKEHQREGRALGLRQLGKDKPLSVAYLLDVDTIDVGMQQVTDERQRLFNDLITDADETMIAKFRPSDFEKIARGQYTSAGENKE